MATHFINLKFKILKMIMLINLYYFHYYNYIIIIKRNLIYTYILYKNNTKRYITSWLSCCISTWRTPGLELLPMLRCFFAINIPWKLEHNSLGKRPEAHQLFTLIGSLKTGWFVGVDGSTVSLSNS